MQRSDLSTGVPRGDVGDDASTVMAMSNASDTSDWGIRPGSWLWGTQLRILFVIDGRIELTKDPSEFGLGYVLETLRDPSFAWWVRFKVDVASRDKKFVSPAGDTVLTDSGGNKYFAYFRFDQRNFDLDYYDQVWFFGDNPGARSDDRGVTDQIINDGNNAPLSDAELRILAEWMDRGGGVFAVGDHGLLGASMCSRIPRVRTMRKWKLAQGVPPKEGYHAHRTLTPRYSAPGRVLEGDEWPQRIYPVYQTIAETSNAYPQQTVHPLLCGRFGILDTFPDHMHEGEVVADEDVDLTLALRIPGYARPEYPYRVVGGPPQPQRIWPTPRVIAHGLTTNSSTKLFPLIGVYDGDSLHDGDSVRLGRVVVDSTWHHWFSMNLVGFVRTRPEYYRRMQDYYRNVGLWLATPAQRTSMLCAATWGALCGSPPMSFQGSLSPWEVGQRAIDVIGRTAPQCILRELVLGALGGEAASVSEVPRELSEAEPCWSCIPAELVNRAIVGSIGAALLDLSFEHEEARIRGEWPRLDPDAIRRHAGEGLVAGHKLLLDSLGQAATDASELRQRLESTIRTPQAEEIPISVGLTPIKIVAESLQFPDATDPELANGPLTLTARVFLDGSVRAIRVLDDVELPEFDAHGGVITLGETTLAEMVVQDGERLTVELLAGTWSAGYVDPQFVRFADTQGGDVSGWLGSHPPHLAQPWRLWYRVEQVANDPDGDPDESEGSESPIEGD